MPGITSDKPQSDSPRTSVDRIVFGLAVAIILLACLPLILAGDDAGPPVESATLIVSLPLLILGVLMSWSLVKSLRAHVAETANPPQ